MEERSKLTELFSEATFLALLTVGAYWISFRYEAADLDTFGVPPSLAELRLELILTIGLTLSGAFGLIFAVNNLPAMFWPSHPALQEKLLRIGLFLLFPLWHFYNYGFRKQDWLIYAIFLVIIVIFEFLWPILVYKKEESFKNRFIADEDAEVGPRSRTITGRLTTIIGPVAYMIILLFFLGSYFASMSGKAEAITKKEYFLLIDEPNIVVVRIYSDHLICVRFDEKTKEIQPFLIIRKIEDEKNLELARKEVGPLQFPRTK